MPYKYTITQETVYCLAMMAHLLLGKYNNNVNDNNDRSAANYLRMTYGLKTDEMSANDCLACNSHF